jgi:hypothetical protein
MYNSAIYQIPTTAGRTAATTAVLLLLTFLYGCSALIQRQTEEFTLVESTTIAEGSRRYIVGTVKNNTPKEYELVKIEFILFDQSGAQVGTSFDSITNLAPYATWKFKASISAENASEYQLKGFTKYQR